MLTHVLDDLRDSDDKVFTRQVLVPSVTEHGATGGEVYVPKGKKGRAASGDVPSVVLPHHLSVALESLAAADMGAWAGHGLYTPLLAALAAQGFTTPTPVQEACLPAAVHGRRDIIGAAQTVRHARPARIRGKGQLNLDGH